MKNGSVLSTKATRVSVPRGLRVSSRRKPSWCVSWILMIGWPQTRVQTLVSAMARRDGIQLVVFQISAKSGPTVAKIFANTCSTRPTRAMIKATLLNRPRLPFKHSGSLYRRSTALELGSYDRDLPCKIDIDLYLKFLRANYLPEHVDRVLVDFRMHKNSVSVHRLTGIKVWIYLIDSLRAV